MIVSLIMAGGFGSRFGSKTPKQYCKIGGEAVISRSVRAFFELQEKIIAVIRKEDEELFRISCPSLEYTFGGDTRQDSVLKGLEHAAKYNPEFVLIADAARPFTSKTLIERVISELEMGEVAVIPCIKICDTIKRVKDGKIISTLNREEVMLAQTPQGFDFSLALKLHTKYKGLNAMDDSHLFEKEGIKVKIVQGEQENIKITTKDDIKLYRPKQV